MIRPRALGLWAVMLVATATRLPAQNNTAEMLQRAIRLYEQVEIEDALGILRQIVSPSSPFEVSPEQRVQAYKYLGAVLALEPGPEKRDSAIAYFRAAIQRDPAVDLDPQSFTPAQVAALAEARNQSFAVAVRPLQPDTLDSSAATITFQCLTSHAATLHAELRSDTVTVRVLYDGPYAGLLEITWDGTLSGGDLAPPGRYEMALIGQSSLLHVADSAAVYFDLTLDHPALEDTLPDLSPDDLLPEVGSNNRQIPANIAENQRRQADRAANNAAVVERNAEVLRQSKRVITPVAGGGP